MNILNQRDIRWKNVLINGTTSTIGNYGCTLTCLAMLADTTPDVVASKLDFSVDRIIWTSINKTDLPIRFPDMGRAYSYDNDKVKEAIDKNGGCLVEVDFDGVISTPNDRHWVLFVGGGKAYDPWTGTEILTTKYSILKGFCIINKIPKSDIISGEMTEEQKRILDFIGNKTEGDVREAFGALADIPIKEKQIQTLQENVLSLNNFVNDLESRLSTLEGELAKNLKLVEDWQTETMTANKALESIEEQLSLTTNEKNNYKKWYEAKCDEIKLLEKMTPLQHIIYGIKKLFIKK